MSLALDELRETDESFDVEGFNFVIEKDLLQQATPIKIDVTYMGFVVQSGMELGAGGSCSAGSCSTGGCGSGGSCC